jgi:excisionase family DNA binding protein
MVTELYPGYLTVLEAAEQCAVHTETVKRWIWAGRLPSRLVHGIHLIARVDLDAYEDRQERLILGLDLAP